MLDFLVLEFSSKLVSSNQYFSVDTPIFLYILIFLHKWKIPVQYSMYNVHTLLVTSTAQFTIILSPKVCFDYNSFFYYQGNSFIQVQHGILYNNGRVVSLVIFSCFSKTLSCHFPSKYFQLLVKMMFG